MSNRVNAELGSNEMDVITNSSSRRNSESLPYLHKVGVPPKQSLLKEIAGTVKETFFADDPLRNFKDQSRSRKLVLGIQAFFPIFEWGRNYSLSKFKGDLIAGLTLASLVIPQDFGYAKLANLDPQYGLYSSFVPPLVYAFMGTSRELAIGPVAMVSLLLGTLLQEEIDPIKNKVDYRRLAFTATFFAGITQAALGFLRLGFLIDFLSHAAIVGFMAGAAVTISLQQLKGLLGIKKFTKNTDIVSVMRSVWSSVHHGWNWQTILIGVSFLAFLMLAKYIGKKKKKFFWVAAIAPLISVILSTFFVYITRADKHGVQIVKNIRKGINPPSVDQIFFSGEYLAKGFRIGLVAGMIALTEAVSIGRTFASMKNYQLDGNKEMVALGTMNIVGSMTSCFLTTGGFARSAVNCMAGCNTAVSNIVMSGVVFLTLKFITPLFKYTPSAVLASIIISAVIGLIDFEAVCLIWKIDKFDFVACMGAFFGVVFISVEIGLLIALQDLAQQFLESFQGLLFTGASFNIQMLQKFLASLLSELILQFTSPTPTMILRWLADEVENLKEYSQSRIQYLIVEMSPVTDIDTSGIHALEELFKILEKRDVKLVLANPGPVVVDKLHASKFQELIGEDRIFLTVADAVMTCAPKLELVP
ncbi:sulfate anion transporter [Corchorus olitorius]|uniref:Sulfate anion transporter n=1 Tax=Corchorus olitorius TaxID=93759 RepID=A0A1R3GQF5_9ROSI|nr:sulfate anion transporter [Corchorus olitorius]